VPGEHCRSSSTSSSSNNSSSSSSLSANSLFIFCRHILPWSDWQVEGAESYLAVGLAGRRAEERGSYCVTGGMEGEAV
jgi:hypothetical protein